MEEGKWKERAGWGSREKCDWEEGRRKEGVREGRGRRDIERKMDERYKKRKWRISTNKKKKILRKDKQNFITKTGIGRNKARRPKPEKGKRR